MRIEPFKEIHPINHISNYDPASGKAHDFSRGSTSANDKVEISDEGMLLLKNAKPTSM